MSKISWMAVLACVIASAGCRSAPSTRAAEQQIVPKENEVALGGQLDRNLDRAYGAWNDPALEKILDSLMLRLASADSSYSEVKGAQIHLLATQTPYLAPGFRNTVYISRGMLAAVEYENELAFLLGVGLALLKEHAVVHNLATLHGQDVGENLMKLPTASPGTQTDYLAADWFEAGGLFDFGSVTWIKAEQDGIRLSYAAKYDPRGAVTLVQRWSTSTSGRQMKGLGKILPEPEERLVSARDEVAKLSPLRDPIVKSPAFEELEARLRVKKAKNKKKLARMQSEPGTEKSNVTH